MGKLTASQRSWIAVGLSFPGLVLLVALAIFFDHLSTTSRLLNSRDCPGCSDRGWKAKCDFVLSNTMDECRKIFSDGRFQAHFGVLRADTLWSTGQESLVSADVNRTIQGGGWVSNPDVYTKNCHSLRVRFLTRTDSIVWSKVYGCMSIDFRKGERNHDSYVLLPITRLIGDFICVASDSGKIRLSDLSDLRDNSRNRTLRLICRKIIKLKISDKYHPGMSLDLVD